MADMAFKRSAVRSRLSPPQNTDFCLKSRCFSNFLGIMSSVGQQTGQQKGHFRSILLSKGGQDGLHSRKNQGKENCVLQVQDLLGS